MKIQQHKKLIRFILLDLLIILLLVVYFGIIRPHYHPVSPIHGVLIENPKEISAISLQDSDGKPFTKQNLLGRWSLVFFGFTHCPMICPTTLSELNKAYQILQKKMPGSLLPQIVFITIDPEKDNAQRLKTYLNQFNPHFVGARADETVTHALEQQFSIMSQRTSGGFNHSADILVINPEAKVQAYLTYPHQGEAIATDFMIISKTSN